MFEGLFGGKKEEKKENVVRPTLSIAPGPVAPAAPAAPATASGKEISAEVEDIKKEVDKVKDSLNALRGSLKSVTEKLEEMEKNLGQLASVYEVIMNQMNPFLDEEERAVAKKVAPAAETVVEVQKPVFVEEKGGGEVVLPRVDLTNPKVIQIIMDWMRFLVERVGHEGVQELLKYYVDIRWISEDVAQVLQRYAEGIRVENEPVIEPPVQLDPEDHLKSLDYILQIRELMG